MSKKARYKATYCGMGALEIRDLNIFAFIQQVKSMKEDEGVRGKLMKSNKQQF